jgi:hypothetical protein
MNSLETLKLVLTLISGICWTIVYIDGIRLGFKHRSYAIPFYALALNISWELLQACYGFQRPLTVQTVINAIWFLFDVGIVITYFKFGRKYFPNRDAKDSSTFFRWSVLGLLTALLVEVAFIREFGVSVGAGYSAFLQNLLMSILFIDMLVKRGSREGQSLVIAVNKWLGTLAATMLFGFLGHGGLPRGSVLILMTGLLCSVFDLIYIHLLLLTRPFPTEPGQHAA